MSRESYPPGSPGEDPSSSLEAQPSTQRCLARSSWSGLRIIILDPGVSGHLPRTLAPWTKPVPVLATGRLAAFKPSWTCCRRRSLTLTRCARRCSRTPATNTNLHPNMNTNPHPNCNIICTSIPSYRPGRSIIFGRSTQESSSVNYPLRSARYRIRSPILLSRPNCSPLPTRIQVLPLLFKFKLPVSPCCRLRSRPSLLGPSVSNSMVQSQLFQSLGLLSAGTWPQLFLVERSDQAPALLFSLMSSTRPLPSCSLSNATSREHIVTKIEDHWIFTLSRVAAIRRVRSLCMLTLSAPHLNTEPLPRPRTHIWLQVNPW